MLLLLRMLFFLSRFCENFLVHLLSVWFGSVCMCHFLSAIVLCLFAFLLLNMNHGSLSSHLPPGDWSSHRRYSVAFLVGTESPVPNPHSYWHYRHQIFALIFDSFFYLSVVAVWVYHTLSIAVVSHYLPLMFKSFLFNNLTTKTNNLQTISLALVFPFSLMCVS